MKQIKKYVTENAPDKLKDKVNEIFEEGRIGLIVNERVLNMPLEFGPMLHDNLHKETYEECKKNGTYLKYFFILSKMYYQKGGIDASEEKKKQKSEPLFQKPEEAFYYHKSLLKFTFPLKFNYTYDENAVGMEYNLERLGVAMFVDAKHEKMQKLLRTMRLELNPQQSGPRQEGTTTDGN
jgi:hypothetical protein